MDPRELTTSAAARATGVLPHLRRVVGRVLSVRTALGAAREIRGLGQHVLVYPLGWRAPALQTHEHPPTEDALEMPVVLVHGYFHNRSGFFVMARVLRRRGFRWIYAMNYNPLGETIPSLAARLAGHVDEILRISGAPRVHVVGHSLGGLVARWYVQELDGARHVDHCVTIGTPHAGTYMAYLGLGETAREMRPGSLLLRRLAEGFARCPTKFVNLYSDLDVLIVPPASAVLPDIPRIHNHLIHDLGHTSLLMSQELMELVVEHLASNEVRTTLAEVKQILPGKRRKQAGGEGA